MSFASIQIHDNKYVDVLAQMLELDIVIIFFEKSGNKCKILGCNSVFIKGIPKNYTLTPTF